MHPSILKALLIASLLGGLATPAAAQRACRPPLKSVGGTCVASCPSGYEDRGRTCAPGFSQPQAGGFSAPAGGFSPQTYCTPPLKFAAGACVADCPGGYEDRGRFCNLRSDN